MPSPCPALPDPSPAFVAKKADVLHQLAAPPGEYTDASPKGSVDERVRPLLDDINRTDGFVSTSSCAGRVSIFLEGRRTPIRGSEPASRQVAAVGGKGAGGTWLFVSHEPVDCRRHDDGWTGLLGFEPADRCYGAAEEMPDRRLIHFKFEPMILHILTASPNHAQLLLRAALDAGFRESGAVNLTGSSGLRSATPMVAVRSMGLSLESLLGFATPDGRRRRWLVPPVHLRTLLSVANERFAENAKRMDRFRAAFRLGVGLASEPRVNADGRMWEDAGARRERMRAEGLRRKAVRSVEDKEKDDEGDESHVGTSEVVAG